MENLKLSTSQLLDLCSQTQPTTVNGLWQEHLEIRKILNEIQQNQKSGDDKNEICPNRQETMKDFLNWCDKMGVKRSDGIEISTIAGRGMGLIATKSFEFGEILVSVPSKSMITLEYARSKSELKRAFAIDPILFKMENVALSIHLANEKLKKNESLFDCYIRSLPNSFSTPLYFEPNELQLLKGSQYFEESLKLWRNIARQYAYFYQLMANDQNIFRDSHLNMKNFTFELYKWATAAVMTRLNFIPHEKKTTPVLIPFWDMANHDAQLPMCTDYDDETSTGLLYSGKKYEAGQEICIFYGPRTNGEFFLHNGFIVDDDSNDQRDSFVVRLGLTKNDPLFSLKENVLNKFNLDTAQNFVLRKNDESSSLHLLMLFAEIFNADESQLKRVLGSDAVFDDETKLKAKNFLKIRLELLKKTYATDDADTTENGKLALKLIRKEKKVLQYSIDRL